MSWSGLRSMFYQDKTNARHDSGCALSHMIFLKVTSCFASETVVTKYLANKKNLPNDGVECQSVVPLRLLLKLRKSLTCCWFFHQ